MFYQWTYPLYQSRVSVRVYQSPFSSRFVCTRMFISKWAPESRWHRIVCLHIPLHTPPPAALSIMPTWLITIAAASAGHPPWSAWPDTDLVTVYNSQFPGPATSSVRWFADFVLRNGFCSTDMNYDDTKAASWSLYVGRNTTKRSLKGQQRFTYLEWACEREQKKMPPADIKKNQPPSLPCN